MRITIALALSLLALNAWGSGTLKDPYGILEKSDVFLGAVPFEDAVGCGDSAMREHKECYVKCNIDGVCDEYCQAPEHVYFDVTACTVDERTIVSERDGFNPETTTLTRAQYEASHGNYLRYLLTEMLRYDEDSVELEYSSENPYVIDEKLTVPSFRVLLTWYRYDEVSGETYEFPIGVTLAKGLPWVAQEIEHDLTPRNYGTPTERLVRFKRASVKAQ